MSKKEILCGYENHWDISYPTQRVGRKSRNPIIRFLDWFHQGAGSHIDAPYIIGYANFPFTLALCIYLPIEFNDSSYVLLGLGIGYVIYCLSILLVIPMTIYRHYRHKYFKQHNLPGPYGWGTLDKHHNFLP